MGKRETNSLLLAMTLLAAATGVTTLLVGSPTGQWVFWAHALVGFSLATLVFWKRPIVVRSFQRRGLGWSSLASLALTVFVLGALLSGIVFALEDVPRLPMPGLGGLPLLTLHVIFALLALPLLILHVLLRRPAPKPVDVAGRRALLRMAGVGSVGFLLWRGNEALSSVLPAAEAEQRFTGSRETGSHAGSFPVTQWLTDSVPEVDARAWRLSVDGLVRAPLTLTLADLDADRPDESSEPLDCTGGWFTVQRWSGISVARLLERAGIEEGVRSFHVRSATGYGRSFPIGEADRIILATRMEGSPLTVGHGFPARVIVPGRRGYEWVKWVEAIEVSERPAWLQPPLPLQ